MVKRCKSCGKSYRTVTEITRAGGEVRQLGLALLGRCVCGGDIGRVNRLWRKTEERQFEQAADQARKN